MHQTSILIVDDDVGMIRLLKANLEARGYKVFVAKDGAEAIQAVEMNEPNLVILDILLPQIDGREVCKRIRDWYKAPIIMLSALGSTFSKTQCLDLGADDYLTKPFDIEELLARIRAMLRRTMPGETSTTPFIACGNLLINFAKRQVTLEGKEVRMTPTEFSLLQELVLNAGKILTQSQLLNKIWGPRYEEEIEYLREYISHLRNKIEADSLHPEYILTVKGVGYMFKGIDREEKPGHDTL